MTPKTTKGTTTLHEHWTRLRARVQLRSVNSWRRLRAWMVDHEPHLLGGVLATFAAVSWHLYPFLAELVPAWLSNRDSEQRLGELLLGLGAALTGASAIAFSLVLFAIQVNIERMPYGMFRRLSLDARLLSAFSGTFLLSILVATSSLLTARALAPLVLLLDFWAAFFTLVLFAYSYGRAIELTNPRAQLGLMVRDTRRRLERFAHLGHISRPLWKGADKAAADVGSTHDFALISFFAANPGWEKPAKTSIAHAMAYARTLAQKGDHDVSTVALEAVVHTMQAYVSAKGKTFFHENALFPMGLAHDGVISDCLELIRQNVRHGLNDADEEFVESLLRAFGALCLLFARIDYSHERAELTHAHLASGYLSDAVRDVLPHGMPDVVMEGIRTIAKCAETYIALKHHNDIQPLAQRIGQLGAASLALSGQRPAAAIAMERLSDLTFRLLQVDGDSKYAIERVRESIHFIATVFMGAPTPHAFMEEQTYLGAYFSLATHDGFAQKLVQLANAVLEAPTDSREARLVLRNIGHWAEGLPTAHRDLLKVAVQKQSHLAFDLLRTSVEFAKILMALSTAPSSTEVLSKQLVDIAERLLRIVSWIPGDANSVRFIEAAQPIELLLEAGLEAHRRNVGDAVAVVHKLLLGWAIKAGLHPGWASLSGSLEAAGLLALHCDLPEAPLLEAVRVALAATVLPEGVQWSAVRDLREAADEYVDGQLAIRVADRLKGQVDPARRRTLFHALAQLVEEAPAAAEPDAPA